MSVKQGKHLTSTLTSTISDADTAASMNALYDMAIDADAIAPAIGYTIEQPGDFDVNEIILRPTRQEL